MRAFFRLALGGALLLGGGCGGYKLGPASSQLAGATSVQIQPVRNRTLEPHLSDSLTTALRFRFQRDGTYKLATQDDGDLVMTGEIIRYERIALSYQPTDILTPLDMRLEMTAQIKVVERASGKVVLDRDVSGYTLIRVGSDLTSAERQAMPLLTGDVANNVSRLLDSKAW